jgi:hypothetical protein
MASPIAGGSPQRKLPQSAPYPWSSTVQDIDRLGSLVTHQAHRMPRVRSPWNPGRVLESLIYPQAGVISRAQTLRLAGRTDEWIHARLIRRQWQQVLPGVYATFTGPLPWGSRAWAGLLYAGEGAVLGGPSALRAGGMKLWRPPAGITICVPHERKVQPQEGYVFVRRRHLERLVHKRPTPPQLRLEIALLEYASTMSTGGTAFGVLADGCQQRLVTPERLLSALLLKPRLRWRRALLSILDDVAAGAYSFLEYTYLRKVERAHRLPMGRRQVPVETPGGRFFRDVLYEPFAVACELDGRLGHEDFVGRARDMRRDNVASDLELVTYRFGYLQIVDTPCLTALTVADALNRRGWRGTAVACGPGCEVRGNSSAP